MVQQYEVTPKRAERILKGTALAIAVIGIGMDLIPGLGGVGTIVFLEGAGLFAFVDRQKNKTK
jgi:hypothetical protein